MSSDPRRGLGIALLVAAACLGWFVALALWEAPLAERLGMNRHAVSFLAGFGAIAAGVTALVFARFAAVRAELLAGRRVLGRWVVDEATWAAVMPEALADDARDRRAALTLVLGLLAVAFGGVAVVDPEAAIGMVAIGTAVAAVIGTAAWLGRRVEIAHARRDTGLVVVGERGLLRDGVLHVWALPLSRLADARITPRPPALTVTYGWWSRIGWQEVSVMLPVPPDAWEDACRVEEALSSRLGRRPRRRTGQRR